MININDGVNYKSEIMTKFYAVETAEKKRLQIFL